MSALPSRVGWFGLGALTFPIALEITTRILGRSVVDPGKRRK